MNWNYPPARNHRCASLIWTVSLLGFLGIATAAEPPWQIHGPLKTSPSGRALVHHDGTPFLWLGDTAWALHQNLKRPYVQQYLADARTNGFTVIQLMAANAWALKSGKNPYGHWPYLRDDPTHLNPLYWDYLAWVIDEAGRHNLYVLLVYGGPGRSDERMLFVESPEQAYAYARAVGFHLRDKPNLIWSNGIDVNPDDEKRVSDMGMAGWQAMAEGVADGVNEVNRFDGRADYSTTLMTYHPRGGSTSSTWFHRAPWLDFNGAQIGLKTPRALCDILAGDYGKQPAKPVINLEPWYEGVDWKKPPVNDWDARLQAYQSLFAGAFGHTYGHTYIWAFDSENQWGWKWRVKLDSPGRRQMKQVRVFMAFPGFFQLVPDSSIVVASPTNAHRTYAIHQRIAAMMAADKSSATVYSPQGQAFTLDLRQFSGKAVQARWFDPRTGHCQDAGKQAGKVRVQFTPPGRPAEGNDWVLFLQSTDPQPK